MLEGALRFAVVIEVELVHRSVADGPGVCDVPLLKSFVGNGPESGNVCTRGLKLRERRDHMVVVEVVIKTEVLLAIEPVIDLDRELIAAIGLRWSGLDRITVVGWGWDKLQEINGSGIQASKRDNVFLAGR